MRPLPHTDALILLVLGLLLGSAGLSGCGETRASTTLDPVLPPSAWSADLQVLAHELPRRHANAFHTASRAAFYGAVDALEASLPGMSQDSVVVALRRIGAMIGDGHTAVALPASWPWLPLRFSWFGDPASDPGGLELRVTKARLPYEAALGKRVVGVGDHSLEEAYQALSTVIAQGESPGSSRVASSVLLLRPQLLHGLGLTLSADSVRFTFADAAGEHFDLWVSANASGEWKRAAPQPAIYLSRQGETFWFTRLPEAEGNPSTVYLAFNEYPSYFSFWRRSRALLAYLDRRDAGRLVIDLRNNTGGDFNKVRRLLIPSLRKRPHMDVYVLTGPRTFSAAMTNAVDFRDRLGAVLVGEPTGARPNQYQEGRSFTLPNSDLRVSYSTRYYRFQEEDTPGVLPDHYAAPTWEDYVAGRDPALEWVLAQPVRPAAPPR